MCGYSSELHTSVEGKWAVAKSAATAILIGAFILLAAMTWNRPIVTVHESLQASRLAAENDILWQQLSVISPRVKRVEIEAIQLHERAEKLYMLLHPREASGNTVPRFTNAAEEPLLGSMIPLTASFSPWVQSSAKADHQKE